VNNSENDPTDEERTRVEQLNAVADIVFTEVKKAWPDLHPVLSLRYGIADALWSAGFRRSDTPGRNDDTAHRLSLFLDEVTGSLLSKSTYDVATMVHATDERYARLRDEAIADALSDAAEEQGEPSDAQVEAALVAWYGIVPGKSDRAWRYMRAALRAARGVR
jgi:hypothetical protein